MSKASRRRADKALMRASWRVALDRRQSRKARKAARKVALAFGFRVLFRWHGPPSKKLEDLTGNFRYGNYCGIGVGVSAGETAAPIDSLDAACREHDKAYL